MPPWVPVGWVPPPTDPSAPPTSAQVVHARPETIIHYVVGIHYEHELGESCDWCTVALDSQITVEYSEVQECDWQPPAVLADGPIGRTCEEALALPQLSEEALAETADT